MKIVLEDNWNKLFANKEYRLGKLHLKNSLNKEKFLDKISVIKAYMIENYGIYTDRGMIICIPKFQEFTDMSINFYQFGRSIHFSLYRNPNKIDIESNLRKDYEQLKFQYIINEAFDIDKFKYMKYEDFLEKIFKKLDIE